MTIDKTIEFFNGLECYTPQAKDARDVAIDTMRKYQEIEQIIKKWAVSNHPELTKVEYFDKLVELMNNMSEVEDGEYR